MEWRNLQNRYIFFDAKGEYIRQFDAWILFADNMDSQTSHPNCKLLRHIATSLLEK